MGCIAIMLLLATSTVFSANGGASDDSPKAEKKKRSGWIGVMVQDVNEKIARKTKLDSEEGAYVSEVVDESPADSAGIKEGDIVIEFDGKHLFDSDDLAKAVRKTSPGTKVSLLIVRNGEKQTLSLTVGRNKELKHKMFGVVPHIPDIRVCVRHHVLGLQLLTLNEQLGEYFGAPNNEGVLVEEVETKSTAAEAGFKAGDIITRVGKKTVDEVEKVQKGT